MHSAAMNFALRASASHLFFGRLDLSVTDVPGRSPALQLSRGPRNRTDYTHAKCPSFREISIPSIHFLNAKVRISAHASPQRLTSAGVPLPKDSARRRSRVTSHQSPLTRIMHPCLSSSSAILMPERTPMEITIRDAGGVSVVEVRGRLTIGEPAEQLHEALQAIIKDGVRKVVVILNHVPQIDSSGISTLVRISIRLGREGGVLRLVCGPGRVRDALTVTRLVEAIPTFDSESAAVADF